jgi:hypothetical protein
MANVGIPVRTDIVPKSDYKNKDKKECQPQPFAKNASPPTLQEQHHKWQAHEQIIDLHVKMRS